MGNFRLDWSSKTAEPFASIITFPRGYIGTIPSVKASKRGGWIYHPLQGTEKKPVTLGRADVGREKAANLIEFLIEQTYEINNWEVPFSAVPSVTVHNVNNARGNGGRDGAYVTFPVNNYGYMKLGVGKERSHWNSSGKTWDFELILPTAIVTALSKQVVTVKDAASTIRVNIPDSDDVPQISDLFIKEPLTGFADAMLKYGEDVGVVQSYNRQVINDIPTSEIVDMLLKLEPTYEFDEKRWSVAATDWRSTEFYHQNQDGSQGGLEAAYQIDKRFLMASPKYRTVEVDKAFVNSAETLKAAFEAMGVDVEIETSYDVGMDGMRHTTVSGIEINIPAGKGGDKHNRDGHSFTITQTGVTVKCGYEENEERYIDDASRQALSDMKNLLEG